MNDWQPWHRLQFPLIQADSSRYWVHIEWAPTIYGARWISTQIQFHVLLNISRLLVSLVSLLDCIRPIQPADWRAQIGIGAVSTLRSSIKHAANTICAVIVSGCGLDIVVVYLSYDVRSVDKNELAQHTHTQMKQHIRTYFLNTKQTNNNNNSNKNIIATIELRVQYTLPASIVSTLCFLFALSWRYFVRAASIHSISLIGSTRMALNQLFQVATEHKVGIYGAH